MTAKIPGYKPDAIELFRCQTTDEFAAVLHFLGSVGFNGKAEVVGLDIIGRGALFFENGRVVHAREGAITGIDAVAHMLVWERSEIHLLRRVVAPTREFSCNTDNLIMDATLLADQNAALWRSQGRTLQNVPEPKSGDRPEPEHPTGFLHRKVAPLWVLVAVCLFMLVASCQWLRRAGDEDVFIARKHLDKKDFSERLEQGEDHPVVGLELRMKAVPGGTLRRSFVSAQTGEKKTAVVKIPPFWMAATEVIQEDFEKLTGINPSFFEGEKLPVETVSWGQASQFCRLLTGIERALGRIPSNWEYRLPTEFEWEYACKADDEAPSFNLEDVCWFQDNTSKAPREAGTKKPNAWGLFDLLGNVNEWCLDWMGHTPFEDSKEPASQMPLRACRGGSWRQSADYCTPGKRIPIQWENATNIVGFRPILAPLDARPDVRWEKE